MASSLRLLSILSAILFRRRARSAGGVLPQAVLGLVGGVERELDVLGGRAGDLAERLAGDGREVGEVLALDGRDPLAADKVVVARADADLLGKLV